MQVLPQNSSSDSGEPEAAVSRFSFFRKPQRLWVTTDMEEIAQEGLQKWICLFLPPVSHACPRGLEGTRGRFPVLCLHQECLPVEMQNMLTQNISQLAELPLPWHNPSRQQGSSARTAVPTPDWVCRAFCGGVFFFWQISCVSSGCYLFLTYSGISCARKNMSANLAWGWTQRPHSVMPCTCAVTDIVQGSQVARAITFFAHFALVHVIAQGTRQCSCEMAYPCKLLALHTWQLFLQA